MRWCGEEGEISHIPFCTVHGYDAAQYKCLVLKGMGAVMECSGGGQWRTDIPQCQEGLVEEQKAAEEEEEGTETSQPRTDL